MAQGTVKWFKKELGYGFITSEGKDYFVHWKNIVMDGYKDLAKDDKVEFEITPSDKGEMAASVKKI